MRLSPLALSAFAALLLAGPALAQRPTQRPTVTQVPPKSPPAGQGAPIPGAPLPAPSVNAGSGFGYLQGVAVDSIHGVPLVGAIVQLQGTDRVGVTDSLGRFLVDSVKPGTYPVDVDHPLIDTLGIRLSTLPMSISAHEVTRVVIAVPSSEFLAGRFCTPARRNLGPGVLVGRVREPDSEVAAVGARVSLVYYDPTPTEVAGIAVNVKKTPRVREATVGPDGTYRLCGLPEKYDGKLMAQRKDGGSTAEVQITQEEGVLALRSMSVAPLVTVSSDTGAKGSGAVTRVAKGSARVYGKVTNKAGAPVPEARVSLVGSGAATITKSNGEFVLDSLPAGTQAIIVRKLGFAATEVPVELSSRAPAQVNVQMGLYVPTLAPVEVRSQRDEGLERVGFSGRKKNGTGGYFLTPEQIDSRHAAQFTDLMTAVPGIRVEGSMGHMSITSTRMAGRAGCVTIVVDGSRWQQLEPGDLDAFMQPSEVAAIEVYQPGASVPVEFQAAGQDCTTVVIWTKTNVLRKAKKK